MLFISDYLLSLQRLGRFERSPANGVVELDRRVCSLLYPEYDSFGQGHTDTAAGHCLPCMDGHWCRGHSAGGNLHLSRASYSLATIFHHDAHRVDYRT